MHSALFIHLHLHACATQILIRPLPPPAAYVIRNEAAAFSDCAHLCKTKTAYTRAHERESLSLGTTERRPQRIASSAILFEMKTNSHALLQSERPRRIHNSSGTQTSPKRYEWMHDVRLKLLLPPTDAMQQIIHTAKCREALKENLHLAFSIIGRVLN